MRVRTRFAPSPTGRLHLGNARIAVFNWLFARKYSGDFVVRIEDTDVERLVGDAERHIFEDLRWLGLEWDEAPGTGGDFGPYRQSERRDRHAAALRTLLDKGSAFRCFCPPGESISERRYTGRCRELDPRELDRRLQLGDPFAVRFAAPRRGTVEVEEHSLPSGRASFPAADIDDFVLERAGGGFTYNFAASVDDWEMEITHVIRGSGHLSNTPKQVLVLRALGATPPAYIHLPTLLTPDGGKLAKRSGATPVAELRAQGVPADAVVNYLSLLGWSHPDHKEFLGRFELIDSVSLERVGRSEVRVDPQKLLWLSRQHIASQPLEQLAGELESWRDQGALPPGADWLATVDLLRSRLTTYGEIAEHLKLLRPEGVPTIGELPGPADEVAGQVVLPAVLAELEGLADWRTADLGGAVRAAGKLCGAKGARLFHPVRCALIGSEHGPDIGKLLRALGRVESLSRIRAAAVSDLRRSGEGGLGQIDPARRPD